MATCEHKKEIVVKCVNSSNESLNLEYKGDKEAENNIRSLLKTTRTVVNAKEYIENYKHFKGYISTGKTTELLDTLCYDKKGYRYLVIQRAFLIESKSKKQYYVSLCLSKNRNNIRVSDVTYTLSELKTLDFKISRVPKLLPRPFWDIETLIILALFDKNLTKLTNGEMILLDKQIEVSAQTTKERSQIWKDLETDEFRWNARKFYITHILVERALTDEEKKRVLNWNWQNEYKKKKKLWEKLSKNDLLINETIIHQIYGKGKIVDVVESKGQVKAKFAQKEGVFSLAQSINNNIFRFVNPEINQKFAEQKRLEIELQELSRKIKRINDGLCTTEIDRLIPDRLQWEQMLEEYESVFSAKRTDEVKKMAKESETIKAVFGNMQELQEGADSLVTNILVEKVKENKTGTKFTALVEKDFLRCDNYNYFLYKDAVENYQNLYQRYVGVASTLSNRDMDRSLRRVLQHMKITETDYLLILKKVGNHRRLGLTRYGKTVSEATFRKEFEFVLGLILIEVENEKKRDAMKQLVTNDAEYATKAEKLINTAKKVGVKKRIIQSCVDRGDFEELKRAIDKTRAEIKAKKAKKS